MEGAILDTMTFLENLDFSVVFRAIGIGLLLFWLVVLGWVVFDASERFTSIWARIFSLLLVLLFPLFGLLIYLIIRPKLTAEEEEWSDLERRFLKFEADGLEDCDICGFELMPNYVYCPNCGKELRRKCESCEVYLDPHWGVCPFCGTNQKREGFVQTDEKSAVPAVKEPKPAVSAESVLDTPSPAVATDTSVAKTATSTAADITSTHTLASAQKDSQQLTQTVRRHRKKLGGGTVKRYFNKTMLVMDGFVKYVGNIPLKAVNSSKKASLKTTSSEVDRSKSTSSKGAGSKSSKSKDSKSADSKSTDSKSSISKSSRSKSESNKSESQKSESQKSTSTSKSNKSKKSEKEEKSERSF